jgi:hypothetical protein
MLVSNGRLFFEGVGRMRHEIKCSAWIRSGGQSAFVLTLNNLADLETKLSVVPGRLLEVKQEIGD